ncbi:MAG: energy-coupling factor ABC transporter ATP-binding protein [Candidatus Aquicultorales bacterium]
MIDLKDVAFRYPKSNKEALAGVSLPLEPGEFVAIAGASGSGKSTLLQLLCGLVEPTAGRVTIDGSPGGKRQLRRRCGMVFQSPELQLFEATVFDDVAFALRSAGCDGDIVDRGVKESMAKVGLGGQNVEGRSPFDLSGGQIRRVALAGVIAADPAVLILDEPTCGLDANGRRDLVRLLKRLHREGRAIVCASHDMEFVWEVAERLVVLHEGRIIADGTTVAVFADKGLLETAGLEPPESLQIAETLGSLGFEIRHDENTDEALLSVFSRMAAGGAK